MLAFTAPLIACVEGETLTLPEPSYEAFQRDVYPVLLQDCAFATCHGNPDRFFHVFGPGRQRIDEVIVNDQGEEEVVVTQFYYSNATEQELEESYHRTRAMLNTDSTQDVSQSPLLRKPLEGVGHAGIDRWGRNVYANKNDPNYIRLLKWAKGES